MCLMKSVSCYVPADNHDRHGSRPVTPAHRSAPAHTIFGQLRSDFCSAHTLRPHALPVIRTDPAKTVDAMTR